MIGTEIQNRTDTLTSGGALISFVIGGPRPQITTTAAIAAAALPLLGVPSLATPGGAATPVVVGAGTRAR